MKRISNFVSSNVQDTIVNKIFEARPKGSKNKPKEDKDAKRAPEVSDENIGKIATQGGKKVSVDKAEKIKGKVEAEKNGSQGLFDFDVPVDPEGKDWETMDPDTMSKNALLLANAFESEENFIALGDAGWAKTSLIKEMALKKGYHIMTVYLDKAEASDIEGISIPAKISDDVLNNGYATLKALPTWAVKMWDLVSDGKKVLLFFDELNQAQPDVLNALMPIVHEHVIAGRKFPNILIGAAGNNQDENDSVEDIRAHRPLMARFTTHINWETHTKATWDEYFEYAHRQYDASCGKELIDRLDSLRDYWSAPRDITMAILRWYEKNKGKAKFMTAEMMYNDRLMEFCIWNKLPEKTLNSHAFKKDMMGFAEWFLNYTRSGGQSEDTGRRGSKKDGNQVDKDSKEEIVTALENGYWFFSKARYGEEATNDKYICTVENCVTEIFDPSVWGVTAEILKKIVREMEASGREPKYYTNDDAKKAKATSKGHKWPSGEQEFMAEIKPINFDAPEEKEKKETKRKTEE